MRPMKHVMLAVAVSVITGFPAASAFALPVAPRLEPAATPAQMGILDLFADDDDYVHDRHYDWDQYRNSTSRKERIRDYYRMQKEAEKDYWRAQKQMQKDMIKRQRGW